MRVLKTDDSVSVSLSRVRLDEQQMDCLYNIFILPSFCFHSYSSICLPAHLPLSSAFLSSMLPCPSVRFSLHFVTRITLSIRHLFLCVSSIRLCAARVESTRHRCLWAVVSCRPAVNSEQRLTERTPDLLVFVTSASQRVLKGVSAGSVTLSGFDSVLIVWLELGGNNIRFNLLWIQPFKMFQRAFLMCQ